jgi:hypothetical protein
MYSAINKYIPFEQITDLFILPAHKDKKLLKAKKEMLWYRGSDMHKETFRTILSKTNRNLPVLPDTHMYTSTWAAFTDEAKAIILYLGFHAASSNNHLHINKLVKEYQVQIILFFDFSYDEFKITSYGRELLSALFEYNYQGQRIDNNLDGFKIEGKIKLSQQSTVIDAPTAIFSGGCGSDMVPVSLFQSLQSKQVDQGAFFVQTRETNNGALCVNQHAYNNYKQFEFYMDSNMVIRDDFDELAKHICVNGGYYYVYGRKLDQSINQYKMDCYLLNMLNKIAKTIDSLPKGTKAPIVYMVINTIKEILENQELYLLFERLYHSGVQLCFCETGVFEERYIYDLFLKRFNAVHIVGRCNITPQHDNYLPVKVKDTMRGAQVKVREAYVMDETGVLFKEGLINLDFVPFYHQIKGRFIRMF